LNSSAFLARPAFIISHAAPEAIAIRRVTCGSRCNVVLRVSTTSVGMRLEIQLPTPPVGYVGVQLGGGEIGMTEHFLDRSQVGSSLEEVRSKRMTE